MFGIGNDQFADQGDQQDSAAASDDLVGRIMAMEYNLAIQGQAPQQSAPGALAQMFGQWLQNRFSR